MGTTEFPTEAEVTFQTSYFRSGSELPGALGNSKVEDAPAIQFPRRFALPVALVPLRVATIPPLIVGWSLTFVSMYLVTVLERGRPGSALAIVTYSIRTLIAAVLLVPAIGVWTASSFVWEWMNERRP